MTKDPESVCWSQNIMSWDAEEYRPSPKGEGDIPEHLSEWYFDASTLMNGSFVFITWLNHLSTLHMNFKHHKKALFASHSTFVMSSIENNGHDVTSVIEWTMDDVRRPIVLKISPLDSDIYDNILGHDFFGWASEMHSLPDDK